MLYTGESVISQLIGCRFSPDQFSGSCRIRTLDSVPPPQDDDRSRGDHCAPRHTCRYVDPQRLYRVWVQLTGVQHRRDTDWTGRAVRTRCKEFPTDCVIDTLNLWYVVSCWEQDAFLLIDFSELIEMTASKIIHWLIWKGHATNWFRCQTADSY